VREKPRPGRTRRLSTQELANCSLHPSSGRTLDGRAADYGSQLVDGTRSDLGDLGCASIATALLLSSLIQRLTSDTGAATLSDVRGDLPGRSARGRSAACKAVSDTATTKPQSRRLPVLVEVVLLDLLVVLDGHCCRFWSRPVVSTAGDRKRLRSSVTVGKFLRLASAGPTFRRDIRVSVHDCPAK
jgi:hypothetical protein